MASRISDDTADHIHYSSDYIRGRYGNEPPPEHGWYEQGGDLKATP